MSNDHAVSTNHEPVGSNSFPWRVLMIYKQFSNLIVLIVIPYRTSVNTSERSMKHEIQVFKLHDMQIVCCTLFIEDISHNDLISIIAPSNDELFWIVPDALELLDLSTKHENDTSENLRNENKSFKNEPNLDIWVFLILFMNIACYVLDVQDREQVEVGNQHIKQSWYSVISFCFKVGL